MSDSDFFNDPEDQLESKTTVDRAYAGSDGHTFLGKRLEGWSGRRRAAAFEIGFTGSGSVVDPVRVVYSCVIEPNEVAAVFRNAIPATERFLQWAEENQCLNPSDKNWEEAFNVAQKIIEAAEKSEFEIDDNGPGGSAPLGNSTGHQD